MSRLWIILGLGAAVATAGRGADAFAIPQPDHVFAYPRDYGAHPEFRIEWWYVTGHLFAAEARRFGFQATFFRLAGPPMGPEVNPDFSRREVFLAHMALTDVKTGRFLHEERLNRAGWDASAAVGQLAVVNGPWSLKMMERDHLHLFGSVEADVALDLDLTPAKPLVVFGEHGVSHKGADPSAASYYLTFSRLATTGKVTLEGTAYQVKGESWMDHEISSSQLGANQVGWDWTCIQLQPTPNAPRRRELMLYRMRLRDGSADPVSRLQWVTPEGRAVTAPFTWEVLETWKSPRSGARYPAKVKLTSVDPDSHQPVTFILEPLVKDQELTNALGGGPYWEGACRVSDGAGQEVGSAYLELTGYAKALKI